jgi:hypothetical protein
MIIFVSVSMFDHKPERCPFSHSLWPGRAQVGWQPCICTAAQEAAQRGRGMGHLWVSCNTCHDGRGTQASLILQVHHLA